MPEPWPGRGISRRKRPARPATLRATQVLVVEAGGAYRARPSRLEGRTDIVFGSPVLVDRIAELAGFE